MRSTEHHARDWSELAELVRQARDKATDRPPFYTTASAIASFRTCKQKFKLSYLDLWRPAAEPKAFAFGHVFHHGVDCHNVGKLLTTALNEAAALGSLMDRVELGKALALIEGYYKRWPQEDRGTVEAESEFVFELVPGIFIMGKRDAVIAGESMIIQETKTSAVLDENYWQRVTIDTQTALYEHSLRVQGFEDVHTEYNVAKKPAIRQKKAETHVEFVKRYAELLLHDCMDWYHRRDIYRTREQYNQIIMDAAATAVEMRDAIAYPRSDQACVGKYGPCQYFGVCTGTQRIDDGSFKKSEKAHAELSMTTGEANDQGKEEHRSQDTTIRDNTQDDLPF